MDFGWCFQMLLFGSPYVALILNEKNELIFNYFLKIQNHLKGKDKVQLIFKFDFCDHFSFYLWSFSFTCMKKKVRITVKKVEVYNWFNYIYIYDNHLNFLMECTLIVVKYDFNFNLKRHFEMEDFKKYVKKR